MYKEIPRSYILTVITVVFASIMSAYLEYNYILLDMIPYREAKQPVIGVFYSYHLEAIIPMIGLLAFQPLIYKMLSRKRCKEDVRITLTLGLASLLLSMVLIDSCWFLFRVLSPLPSDPLAHQWIRPLEPTASIVGHISIFDVIVPLWYMTLIPPVIAIFTAIAITPSHS